MLIVINSHDRDVHPQSNYTFAKSPKAELMELKSEFGHMSFFIEFKTIAGRVREFLSR